LAQRQRSKLIRTNFVQAYPASLSNTPDNRIPATHHQL
jgi:hypothetical protein